MSCRRERGRARDALAACGARRSPRVATRTPSSIAARRHPNTLVDRRASPPEHPRLERVSPPPSRARSARLDSALGSTRLGSTWIGSARLGSTRLSSAWLDPAWLGSGWLDSAWLGWARLGVHGSARLGSRFWRIFKLETYRKVLIASRIPFSEGVRTRNLFASSVLEPKQKNIKKC